MSKHIFIILVTLALSGCAVVSWKHPTKGSGKISTMRDAKGSVEFVHDYHDCEKIADQPVNSLNKSNDPCLAARNHTKCMKEKYGWEIIDKNATQ